MKFISSAIVVAALLAIPTMTKAAVTIDGTADADYGSAIVTQKIGTSTFKNTETNIDASSGSELDAAYGFISNGVLYLVLAGNLDTGDLGSNQYDKLHIFFMTGPGGDHTLGTNYSTAADSGQLNNMGVDGNGTSIGDPGLTFDTGFAPNYWIGLTVGAPGAGPSMYVNYEVVCSNCFGAYLGSVTPSNAPPNNIFVDNQGFGIRAALNNSNTNGVQFDASGCEINGAPFNPQNVRTGVELAIPLSAIGSPTGKVSICALFTDEHYASMYNQVLGPLWDGTTGYCQGSFGAASAVDFSALPGTQSFTLTVPSCNAFLLNPSTASFGTNGGSGSITVSMSGGCSWSVTSNVPWVTITSGGGPNSGNGSFTYSVGTNATIDVRQASLTVSGQFVTASATITQDGRLLPPLGSIIVDGIAEAAYGCPIAVQQLGTGFAKHTSTNVLAGANEDGSEIDAAYGLIVNNVLFLTIAGNLQANPNQNEIQVFFMTGPGGQHSLTNINPNFGPVNIMGGPGRGFTFDPGFAPNYWIGVNQSVNPYHLFADYVQLWPGGTNNPTATATNGYYLGTTTSTNGTLSLGFNPFLIQAALNDSNTNGVTGNSCTTNATGGAQSVAAAQVRSGLELAIPLGALGSPTGAISVCVILSGGGSHDYLSNQLLGPIGTNDPTVSVCQVNLGTTAAIDLGTLPGQHYFLVGPEMAVKSVTVSNSNATVVYQTEANTNLLYRVERAAGNYSTNLVWTPLSGFINGTATGGTLTQVDNNVTSKTNVYYRVRQTPNCQ